MKRFFIDMLAVASIFLLSNVVISCGDDNKDPDPQPEDFTLLINITTPLEVYGGQEVSFNVLNKKGPKSTDQVVLKSPTNEFVLPIKVAQSDFFTFTISEQVVSGSYTFGIRRGSETKNVGKLDLIVKKVVKVDPKEGYNLYGIVTCGDEGVKDVLISDGSEFTKTDANGVYYLRSAEKYAVVFMVVPSGYKAENSGVLPQFYKNIDGNDATTDRADFVLEKVAGQDNHTMLFFGDMHLANRNKDIQQFHVFTDEVNAYLKANSGKNIYAQSLGDMTWDLYWYSQKMSPTEYVTEINKDFPNGNLTLYHCIGNHDHEMGSKITGYPIGDYNCEVAYRKALGPNFFSYNIGQIHYVVLDDIECTNDGVEKSSSGSGEANRTYNSKVISDQIQWLAKDLTYVSKSTPVVLMSHAPMYSASGKASLSNLSSLLDVLSGYKTYFITGHTHEMYNVDKMSDGNHFELNSGSVCATWWWTGNDTSGLYLARDGSNGGYRVFEVNGTDIKWYYKSTAKDKDVQFRTYDGNKAFVDGTGFPSTLVSSISAPWNKQSTDNYVYIEVWDYDPMWKIEVTENGKALTTTRMTLKDPLHYLAYEGKGHSTSSFTTQSTPNMFRVQASSATSTLEIKVTDRFGRVYKETMTRPRAFSLAEYNK